MSAKNNGCSGDPCQGLYWLVFYRCFIKYHAQFRNPQSSILLPQPFRQFFDWNTCPRCRLLPIASSFSPWPRVSAQWWEPWRQLIWCFQLPARCPEPENALGWGDSNLEHQFSSRWTSAGVCHVNCWSHVQRIATKVHPTTSRLLPNKLLWQHLGLPETIANGYPFHAEGCEKLLRRWTTVPSKNLLILVKRSFAVSRILKLDISISNHQRIKALKYAADLKHIFKRKEQLLTTIM